jgi:hypothetical protein
MERSAHKGEKALSGQIRSAIDEPSLLGAIRHRALRNRLDVGLIWLRQVRGVGVWNRSLFTHPRDRDARVETSRKRETDLFPLWNALKDVRHRYLPRNVTDVALSFKKAAFSYTE